MLAVELNLSALNSKTLPESELVTEFSREFAKEKPEVLQWAFRTHRRQSKFFPAISEIAELVDRRRGELWEDGETARHVQEAEDRENARRANQEVVEKLAGLKPKPMPSAEDPVVTRNRLKQQAEELKSKRK